jgi:hypothetical protein
MRNKMMAVTTFLGRMALFMAALLPAYFLARWMCPFDHISPEWIGFVVVYLTLYFWFRKALILAVSKVELICKA